MDTPLVRSSDLPRVSGPWKDRKTSQPDYISELPDEILIYIIDKLPMQDVKSTLLLSKRWKDLWRCKKKVEIDYQWVQKSGMKVLPSILKLFTGFRDQTLHSIKVSLRYDLSLLTKMQSLINYASLRKVTELYIDFNDKNDNTTRWRRRYLPFEIPECELHHSSLVKLSLVSLQLQALPPGNFRALNELFLERVKLGEDTMQKITCNCLFLELLCLTNCNPKDDFQVIIAENSNLLHLIIREDFTEVSKKTDLIIKARGLLSIEFGLALPRSTYHMEESFLCSKATFKLNKMHHSPQAMKVTGFGIRGNTQKNFMELLTKLGGAKMLILSSWCIQVLTIDIIKLQPRLSFEAQHLTLETELDLWEFPGIAYMLLSCCKLENLIIVMGSTTKLNFEYLTRSIYYGITPTIGKILKDLIVVEFKNYSGSYQIWEDGHFSEELFFADFEYGISLLWNLKAFAANLQKIRYTTKKKTFETDHVGNFMDMSSFTCLKNCPKLPTLYGSMKGWGHRLL